MPYINGSTSRKIKDNFVKDTIRVIEHFKVDIDKGIKSALDSCLIKGRKLKIEFYENNA